MSKVDLIKKYANKTAEEMAKEQDSLKEELVAQSLELDSKIRNFSTQIDPIKSDTGEVLAYARRPSAAQFDRLLPPQFLKYKDNPEKIPLEDGIEYAEDVYRLMAELIICPKHNAQEWKELIGDDFIAAFQAHFLKLREEANKTINRFLPRTTDSTS